MRATLFVVAAMMAASPSIGATVTNSYTVTVSTTGGGSLLPPDRDASPNWKMAGLQSIGGIPNRTTVCATVNPIGGGSDDSTAINNAITACPAGEVVSLGSGTFTVAGSNSILLTKGVTLRGAGPGATIVEKPPGTSTHGYPCTSGAGGATLGSACPGTTPSTLIKVGGSAALTATTTLTSDGAKGAYSIQVASTSGFVVGGLVHIDELANGQAMPDCCFNSGTGQVWAEPDMRVTWNVHNPTVAYFDNSNCFTSWGGTANNFSCDTNGDACAYSVRCGGVTEELHLITAVNSGTNTITFDSPLTISYRTAYSAAAHSYPASSLVAYAGVENMTLKYGDEGNLLFTGCVYCWAHEVENTLHLNGGFLFDAASFRDQVDFSYVHDAAWPVNGGAGYNIMLTRGPSELYIFNNIDMLANKVMVVRASGAGSVFAYNYLDDGYIMGSDNWIETGMNCSHLAGSHHVLAEGNWAFNYDSDSTHGSTGHCTAFRNYFPGFRRAFTALDGVTVDDINNLPGGNGPLRAIGDNPYTYWDSFVGNVLGVAGKMGSWSARCTALANYGCTPAIISTGWNSSSVGGSQNDGSDQVSYPTNPTGTITGPACLTSGQSCAPVLDGNYDYKSDFIQWASNDTAHVLPSSLYLSSVPSFFSGYTWPWVVPENATTQLYTLPAKARFEAGTPFTQP